MSKAVSIQAQEVSVIYNNGFTAIQDVSFDLSGGTICALVGVNGGGKSTLFKSIMGLVKLTSGKILLSGMSTQQALKSNLVSYVPQSEDIDWDFPILVKDVVMQGRYGYMGWLKRPTKKDHAIVDQAMQRMGIAELATRQIGELSGGQKKRVFLARALSQQSRIMLLDEPFTGVDFNTENAIMDLLKSLKKQGYLILVSTHNLGNVADYCNDVILINRSVVATGTVETTFTQQNLAATFGGVLKQMGISGSDLHKDDDQRTVTIISDHEKPAVFYGSKTEHSQLLTETSRQDYD
ncbi:MULTISPECIES: metal ABC transporter ATP-binding protein [unclassified Agarivorans]|uniref:metal ABC transporter ATP-binding protein n=1 Tax=unclassified Agarivorans TaxID=2636026 RepID=UPI003D7DB297